MDNKPAENTREPTWKSHAPKGFALKPTDVTTPGNPWSYEIPDSNLIIRGWWSHDTWTEWHNGVNHTSLSGLIRVFEKNNGMQYQLSKIVVTPGIGCVPRKNPVAINWAASDGYTYNWSAQDSFGENSWDKVWVTYEGEATFGAFFQPKYPFSVAVISDSCP